MVRTLYFLGFLISLFNPTFQWDCHNKKVFLRVPQGRLFVYGKKSGSVGSAFCFPYNSVTLGWILFKFGRCMQ